MLCSESIEIRLGEMPYFGAERTCLGAVGQLWGNLFSTKLLSHFNHLIPCQTCESPQLSGSGLKRFLSIFSVLIFDSSVDRGMPSLAAAPLSPNTRPQLAFRASSIMFFCCASSLRGSSLRWLESVAKSGKGSQLSSIEKMSDSQRITERSITFCNSRIFPGQGYD